MIALILTSSPTRTSDVKAISGKFKMWALLGEMDVTRLLKPLPVDISEYLSLIAISDEDLLRSWIAVFASGGGLK